MDKLSTTECNFPECNCIVPDYAFSAHNRRPFCRVFKEGKCMALWEYHKGETEKWNGESCDCELVQGNWNCKLNPF